MLSEEAKTCSYRIRFHLYEARDCLNQTPIKIGDAAVHVSCAQTMLEELCRLAGLPTDMDSITIVPAETTP